VAAADTEIESAPDTEVAPPPAKKGAGKAEKKGAKADKKGEKKGKGEKDAGGEELGGAPNIAAHPRAARSVARVKGWGGLAGFVLAGDLSLPTNTLAGAGLRALVAGVVCYVAAWGGAVFVWRRLVMLELRSREHQIAAAVQATRARRELPAPGAERASARTAS
jgi:predicted lipid-binding transport protein (Tim44 family)